MPTPWRTPTMCRYLLARALVVAMALGSSAWLLMPQTGRAHDPDSKPPTAAGTPVEPDNAQPPGQDHQHDRESREGEAHEHPPVPADYQRAHVPAFAWTNERMLARGKTIHLERCAVCHGEGGDGKGPAFAGLAVKPPDLRNIAMVNEMRGNYWYWRVSEGGAVDPFVSKGSVMPAWKEVLPVEDRWAVIAYHHTFSGHMGPHVTSEHPEMVADHHAGRATAPGTSSAPTKPGATSHPNTHRH